MLGKVAQGGAPGWRMELNNEVEGVFSPEVLIVRLTLSHF